MSHLSGLYVLLMHGPVLGPVAGSAITTAVTPLDITDIARSCRTFGVSGYGIVQPDPNQQALAKRIRDYWMQRSEGPRSDRILALERVEVFSNFDEAFSHWGSGPLIATSASAGSGTISFAEIQRLARQQTTYLVFGTGYGLLAETMQNAHFIAPAILGTGSFTHLSVRSAVAIILDRIINASPG